MNRRNLNGITVGFAVVIVLVVALLIANSLRRSSHIVLPDAAASSAAASAGSQEPDDAQIRIEITPKTVQAAIATLARPARYLRTLQLEMLWSGGSASYQATVAVSDGMTRVDLRQPGGHIRHTITDGKQTYIWYDAEKDYYTGTAGDITADEEQHIPTYESVLELNADSIAAADYRTFSEENCIFVETAPDGGGYVQRYWVSVSSGLLIGSERLQNGETISRMAAQPVGTAQPSAANFTLPDGTVLDAVN